MSPKNRKLALSRRVLDQKNDPAKPSHALRKGRRLWLFRPGTLTLIPIVLLVITELILRLAGMRYPTCFTIKQNVNGRDMYSDNAKFTWQYFPKALARLPFSFNIPEAKSPQTYRIFVLGGAG